MRRFGRGRIDRGRILALGQGEARTVRLRGGRRRSTRAGRVDLCRHRALGGTDAPGARHWCHWCAGHDAGLRPSEPKRHRRALRRDCELQVMLYDVPSRTGRKIAASTTIDLVSTHSNIVAIKDASGDLVSAAHYKSVLGDEIDMYSGDDSVLVPFMGIGAVGIVSVAAPIPMNGTNTESSPLY